MTGALYGLLKTAENNDNLQVQSTTKQPTFYLGGQILYNTDEPITQKMINEVQDKINKTDMSLCWGMEIYSVMEHNRRFDNFKTLYQNYKQYIEHIKYMPNGSGYFETLKNFNNNK